MPVISSHFEYRIPFHPDRSEAEVRAAQELWLHHEKAAAQRRQEQLRVFHAGLADQRDRLLHWLGTENYAAWQRLKHDLRLQGRKPQGPSSRQSLYRAEVARRQMDEVKMFLEKRGMPVEKFAALREQLLSGTALPMLTEITGRIDLMDFGTGPSRADSSVVTVSPPFTGWQIGLDHGLVSGFRTDRIPLLNAAAGHVGNIITLDDDDASDFDTGSVIADTQIAFWYQAPATGLVKATIIADCGEARHQLDVSDEWGVSDSSTTQQGFLMMHALHPNVRGPSFGLVSKFEWKTDNSSHLDEQFLHPGDTVGMTLFSDGPVNAGEWMVIRAGCRNQDGSITNDMEVHSRSTFSWFIKQVHLQIQ